MSTKNSSTRVKRVESMIIHDTSINDEDSKHIVNLCCSYRLFLAFLLGACTLILYAQRQTLNFTLFCMVNENGRFDLLSDVIANNSCRNVHFNTSVETIKPGPFFWDKDIQGLILGSFYWGYCFQLFGGFLGAKIGSKISLALAMGISSVCTVLIPFAADALGNYRILVILRVITGLAQGMVYPSALPLITKWSTKSEKSILWSFITAGSSMGIVLSTFFSGPICSSGYWEFNFIITGTAGFIWLLPWLKFAQNSPDKCGHISNKELSFLKENGDLGKSIEGQSPLKWPLIEILSSRSVWVIVLTNVLSDFTLYGILSVFPSYLSEIYGVDIMTNSYISAGEYCFMLLCTILFGIVSNLLIKSRRLSTLATRRLCNTIGMMIPSLLFPIISFLDCSNISAVIGLLVVAGGAPGAYLSSGFILNAADIAGPYSGIVFGLSNSLGSLTGIVAPYLAHMITNESTVTQWRICFILFSSILFIASLIFLIFSRGNLESWAAVSPTKNEIYKDRSKVVGLENEDDDLVMKLNNSIDDMFVPSDSSENIAKNFDNCVLVRVVNGVDSKANVENV